MNQLFRFCNDSLYGASHAFLIGDDNFVGGEGNIVFGKKNVDWGKDIVLIDEEKMLVDVKEDDLRGWLGNEVRVAIGKIARGPLLSLAPAMNKAADGFVDMCLAKAAASRAQSSAVSDASSSSSSSSTSSTSSLSTPPRGNGSRAAPRRNRRRKRRRPESTESEESGSSSSTTTLRSKQRRWPVYSSSAFSSSSSSSSSSSPSFDTQRPLSSSFLTPRRVPPVERDLAQEESFRQSSKKCQGMFSRILRQREEEERERKQRIDLVESRRHRSGAEEEKKRVREDDGDVLMSLIQANTFSVAAGMMHAFHSLRSSGPLSSSDNANLPLVEDSKEGEEDDGQSSFSTLEEPPVVTETAAAETDKKLVATAGDDTANPKPIDSSKTLPCPLCTEPKTLVACVPCGHITMCYDCGLKVESTSGKCPQCRGEICMLQKVYFSM